MSLDIKGNPHSTHKDVLRKVTQGTAPIPAQEITLHNQAILSNVCMSLQYVYLISVCTQVC